MNANKKQYFVLNICVHLRSFAEKKVFVVGLLFKNI